MKNKYYSVKKLLTNIFFTLWFLGLATAIAFWFFYLSNRNTANIVLVYTVALILIARHTSGYSYGVISALFNVIIINYCFTPPFNTLNFTIEGYPVTFVGMLVISIIVTTLTTRLKKQDHLIHEAEKERIRANLLRAVSHDLRTPLTSIIGACSSYTEGHTDYTTEELLGLISSINDDSHWLLNMVENLLSITRIHEEESKVTKETEVVEEVVCEAVTRLKKRLPDAKIHVTAPEDMLLLPMDPILIEQVLINLLENAVVHSGSSRPIDLQITEEPDAISFHILDYGSGIDPYSVSSFLNGRPTARYTPDTHRGMGIGLSICKTIIQAHDGSIRARNHDYGAEFIFTLPKEKC